MYENQVIQKQIAFDIDTKVAEKIFGSSYRSIYFYIEDTMKKNGFDFLKIDNQSFTLPLYMGNTQVIRQAKDCNRALERQTDKAQIGLMNCMAQNIINTDNTLHSDETRVSIDY